MDKFEIIQNKILDRGDELDRLLSFWRFKNKKIVFTNGCFDIVHKGHVQYLAKAASLGDILVLGLNSDVSVKRLKGEERPVNDLMAKALLLASMQFINLVVPFEEDTPYELIKIVRPNVLVKGGDYTKDQIVGADIVEKNKGEVVTIDFVKGYSTTNILKALK